MENVISAQKLKRRGIGAIDGALRDGPAHETEWLWDALLAEGAPGERAASEIDQQIHTERDSWT